MYVVLRRNDSPEVFLGHDLPPGHYWYEFNGETCAELCTHNGAPSRHMQAAALSKGGTLILSVERAWEEPILGHRLQTASQNTQESIEGLLEQHIKAQHAGNLLAEDTIEALRRVEESQDKQIKLLTRLCLLMERRYSAEAIQDLSGQVDDLSGRLSRLESDY